MAFQLSFTDAAGVTHPVAYHRVTEENLDRLNKMATVVVCTYHDEVTRRLGKEPVLRRVYRAERTVYEDLFDNAKLKLKTPTERGYELISTAADFVGAVAV